MVMGSKQISFSGMRFSVGRLKGIEKIGRRQKIGHTRFDDLLSQLEKKGEMRYGHIVRKFIFVRLDFLRWGITFKVLNWSENMPVDRKMLIILIKVGKRVLRQFSRRQKGTGLQKVSADR
jgi:hypothetical protein